MSARKTPARPAMRSPHEFQVMCSATENFVGLCRGYSVELKALRSERGLLPAARLPPLLLWLPARLSQRAAHWHLEGLGLEASSRLPALAAGARGGADAAAGPAACTGPPRRQALQLCNGSPAAGAPRGRALVPGASLLATVQIPALHDWRFTPRHRPDSSSP